MLKMTASGKLTSDVTLRINEETGQPYAIMRIASKRPYRNRDGDRATDFISIRVRGALAERCARMGYKGCKLTAWGDFETIALDNSRQPGFLLKAREVEFVSPKKPEDPEQMEETQITTQRSGCDLERRSSEMSELSRLRGSEGYGACDDEAAA